MTKPALSSDDITQPSCHTQIWMTKKLVAGINALRSLSWKSAAKTCRYYSVWLSFFWFSGCIRVCFLLLKQEAHTRMGKMEALHTIRTTSSRVRMTCGRRVRDTCYMKGRKLSGFIPVKAQLAKDHQRPGFSQAESNLMTQINGIAPKGAICCCPRGRREALWLDLGSFWRFLRRVSFLHIWGRLKGSSN